jgi:hypothetical protein
MIRGVGNPAVGEVAMVLEKAVGEIHGITNWCNVYTSSCGYDPSNGQDLNAELLAVMKGTYL